MTPVLAVVAPSGSGKTTLLEQAIALLARRGVRVATVKQTHHPVEWDTPGKDSHRLRQAGSIATLLSTPHVTLLARPVASPPALEELLPLLPPADLILAEGFKASAAPKLAVVRSGYPWDPGTLSGVVAVASDGPYPGPWAILDLNDPAAVAAWLAAWVGLEPAP